MFRMQGWIVPAAALVVGTGAMAAPQDKLEVHLTLPSQVVQGDVDVTVDVVVSNPTGHAVNVLKWQLPSQRLQGPLFRITKEDGSVARYVGPLVKRLAPRASDFVRIEAGATLNYRVDLSGTYELGNGRYTIEYDSAGRHDAEAAVRSVAPLYLWTEGRTAKAEPAAATAAAIGPDAASIAYTGNCTASEKGRLVTAVETATRYSTRATGYLASAPRATQRYRQWFGPLTPARWNAVRTHFSKVRDAFRTKPLTLDCSCNDDGLYAYVFSNRPYKIYLCGAFWAAPMTGTDSKGGTLVHEMSHFTVVAGTDDWAYGQSAAAALARSDPTRAVNNADSHEYFSENTPYLP